MLNAVQNTSLPSISQLQLPSQLAEQTQSSLDIEPPNTSNDSYPKLRVILAIASLVVVCLIVVASYAIWIKRSHFVESALPFEEIESNSLQDRAVIPGLTLQRVLSGKDRVEGKIVKSTDNLGGIFALTAERRPDNSTIHSGNDNFGQQPPLATLRVVEADGGISEVTLRSQFPGLVPLLIENMFGDSSDVGVWYKESLEFLLSPPSPFVPLPMGTKQNGSNTLDAYFEGLHLQLSATVLENDGIEETIIIKPDASADLVWRSLSAEMEQAKNQEDKSMHSPQINLNQSITGSQGYYDLTIGNLKPTVTWYQVSLALTPPGNLPRTKEEDLLFTYFDHNKVNFITDGVEWRVEKGSSDSCDTGLEIQQTNENSFRVRCSFNLESTPLTSQPLVTRINVEVVSEDARFGFVELDPLIFPVN